MRKQIVFYLVAILCFFHSIATKPQTSQSYTPPKTTVCDSLKPIIEFVGTLPTNTTGDILVIGEFFSGNSTVSITNSTVNAVNFDPYDTLLVNLTTTTNGIFPLTVTNACGKTTADFEVKSSCLIPDITGTTLWTNVSGSPKLGYGLFGRTITNLPDGWSNNASFGPLNAGDVQHCFEVDNSIGNTAIMIGFNNSSVVNDWQDIEHKVYILSRPGSYHRLYIGNGTTLTLVLDKGANTNFNGDSFCIRRVGTIIEFYYNNTLVGTNIALFSGAVFVSATTYDSNTWSGSIDLTKNKLCEYP